MKGSKYNDLRRVLKTARIWNKSHMRIYYLKKKSLLDENKFNYWRRNRYKSMICPISAYWTSSRARSFCSHKKVIQESHMVNGTRCLAWNDQQKKWGESRAMAPKDRCLVGHRGKFPYILRGNLWFSKGVLHFLKISYQFSVIQWEFSFFFIFSLSIFHIIQLDFQIFFIFLSIFQVTH